MRSEPKTIEQWPTPAGPFFFARPAHSGLRAGRLRRRQREHNFAEQRISEHQLLEELGSACFLCGLRLCDSDCTVCPYDMAIWDSFLFIPCMRNHLNHQNFLSIDIGENCVYLCVCHSTYPETHCILFVHLSE